MKKFLVLFALTLAFSLQKSHAQLTSYSNFGTNLHSAILSAGFDVNNVPQYNARVETINNTPPGRTVIDMLSQVDFEDDQSNTWSAYQENGGGTVLDNIFTYEDPFGAYNFASITYTWLIIYDDSSYEIDTFTIYP